MDSTSPDPKTIANFARLTSAERKLNSQAAAHKSWALTEDRTRRTAKARAAFNQRFYDEVDPDRTLPAAEREKRATNARKSFYAALSRKAVAARRNRAGGAA
ncbi:hypothetical protein ABGB19_02115 [Mycobacterium sp. B14F4]|uniref:hypothetical protein n=1 Tax=Mycobacterium sp. B14F4 TaxID=3153565 RepID=UPI00325F53C1